MSIDTQHGRRSVQVLGPMLRQTGLLNSMRTLSEISRPPKTTPSPSVLGGYLDYTKCELLGTKVNMKEGLAWVQDVYKLRSRYYEEGRWMVSFRAGELDEADVLLCCD